MPAAAARAELSQATGVDQTWGQTFNSTTDKEGRTSAHPAQDNSV